MATGLESRKTSAAETAVERQLADTCERIRRFDAGASLLTLGAAIGGYAIVFAIFDLSVQGADAGWPLFVRWVAYVLFLAVTGLLAWQSLHRVTRRVNPYYAAHRLEATVPGAKNSLINWLDLRDEPLPPALRKTLGGKAAHDLDAADPEQAIDRGPTWVRLGLFAAVLLGVLILFAARPGQFLSLMRRAFLPFYEGQLVGATRITLVRPEDGDTVVTEKQALLVVAQIDGRVPDINRPGAPALLYRYQAGDKFVVQPLQQDGTGAWTTRLLPDQIGSTGLWYKLVAGDAQTPLYQLTVRAQPFVERYEISYRYRPYLNLAPDEVVFPNQQTALPFIKRHRGTEVRLVVHTNRPLRQAGLLLASPKTRQELAAQIRKGEPQTFVAQWVLEQPGDLFVSFTSVDGEVYRSRVPIPVDVLTDAVPTVALTRPAQNVALPANGTLEVEGAADDDLGLKELTLRLEKVEGGKTVALKPLPYQPETPLDLDGTGTYPLHVDYFGLIKLDELRSTLDLPVKLPPGAIIRYWLEATDNSDYPTKTGNVGKSQPYEIKVLPPQDEEKQQQARAQAVSKQRQHQAQQKQKLDKEKQDRQGARNQGSDPAAANKAEQIGNELNKDVKNLDQPKGGSSDKGDAKGSDPRPCDKKSGDGAGAEGAPSADKKDQPPSDKGQAGDSKAGGQQGAPQAAPQAGGGNPQQPGESKDAGGADGKGGDNQPGGAGSGPQGEPSAGAGKDGPQQPSDSGMGKGDGGGDGPGDNQAKGKDGGPKGPPPMPGSKGQGEDGGGKANGQTKPGGGAAKAPGDAQPPQGVAKPEEATGERSLSKEQGPATGKQLNDARLKVAAEKQPGEVVGAGKGEAKAPPRDAAKDVPGLARGEEPAPQDTAPKTPTPQDVEHLKELMQRKDGIGDLAAKALEQMSQEAPDPKVRDLAKNALDQAGPKTAPGAGADNPGAAKTASKAGDPKGPAGDPGGTNAANAKAPPNGDVKPGTAPGGSTGTKIGTPTPAAGKNTTPGTGPGDDSKADPARKDLARFGGNLQLEDFIKRATPEYRAKRGISEAEWQRLLGRAAEYDALLRKLHRQAKAKTPRDGRAASGGFGSAGPTAVQVAPGAVDPTDSGRAEAPPELLDALSRFRNAGSPKR